MNEKLFLYTLSVLSFLCNFVSWSLEPTIWYPEPGFASMGRSKASVTVADVPEDELDREFHQHQILTQLQEFQESISLLNVRYDDL